MTGGKNRAFYLVDESIDESTIKAMVVLSIMIICIGILGIVAIYSLIKDYQEERKEEFEESSQFDQIDYLIHLIVEQEKILDLEMEGQSKIDIENKLERFLDLHKEFSDQLDNLHEMMVGMSKTEFDVRIKGKKRDLIFQPI
mmetsp:Transcript_25346/g.54517  ORF Transcript_25346/g.54517 Transcript_25346/m.54517 type:complete len:142 (-) Transcript_25346:165-590(-)|eukprot:CAMPEP_0172325340 /NCGR_PEP_ID=MMETSP1058-20130122/53748_1 /TAXON_ID=83371 /ORGANISM="Detonula confervacea, Strain CCMP 353" /LENGTH=141 /DNA_ID=CAMNT_0013041859 /DNA_START=144 /DNA_END=569 /DNA_ORIENTATION=+